MEKARQILSDAVAALDEIPPDLTNNTTHDTPPMAASIETPTHTAGGDQEDVTISATAPPVSTTKGSRKRNTGDENEPTPHFKRPKDKQKRRCSKCGQLATGHNAATCERVNAAKEQGVTKRPRGRPRGSGRANKG